MDKQAFRLASILYAVAILYSFLPFLGTQTSPLSSLLEVGVVVAALLVLLPRGQTRALPLLVFFFLAFFAVGMPEHPNHRYVLAFYSCAVAPVAFLLGRRREGEAIEAYWHVARPFVLCLVLLLYFFAFLAKLNVDYLDPEVSCAARFFGHVAVIYNLGFVKESGFVGEQFAISSSIIFELLLIPLLFFRRTRVVGVLLGLVFHFGLALDFIKYFTNFSSVLYLLLLVILGPSFLARSFSSRWLDRAHIYLFPPACILAALYFHLAWTGGDSSAWVSRVLLMICVWLSWLVYSLFVFHRVVRTLLREGGLVDATKSAAPGALWFRGFCVVLGVLVLLNGASPYLGLKTRTAFSMYSNLWIDADGSNHLLFRRSADLLTLMEEGALILPLADPEVDDPGAAMKVCGGALLGGRSYPLIEVGRVLASCPDEDVRFEWRGETYSSQSPAARSLVDGPAFRLLRRFVIFGPLGKEGAAECLW